MTDYRLKPDKIKYLTTIKTLDETHRHFASEFEQKRHLLPEKKRELKNYQKDLKNLENKNKSDYTAKDICLKARLKENIKRVNDDIYDIENNVSEIDYYSKTGNILVEYYNIIENKDESDNSITSDNLELNTETEINQLSEFQEMSEIETEADDITESANFTSTNTETINQFDTVDLLRELNLKSQQKRKIKKPTRKRLRKVEQIKPTKNILSFFGKDEEQPNQVKSKSKSDTKNDSDNDDGHIEKNMVEVVANRASLFDEFMMMIDKAYTSSKVKNTAIKICNNCHIMHGINVEKTLIQSEGLYVCKNCGEAENIIIESEIPNHKESSTEKPKYPYKRLNHLVEQLNQFQAKESTDIDDEVYNKILFEIRKMKIYNLDKLNIKKLKNVLKKLKYTQYYEHVQYILCKLTKKQPPILSREEEENVKNMFRTVQEPWATYCPQNRINFFSYPYVILKIFHILKKKGLLRIEEKEYTDYFYLLKSRTKLRIQEEIWRKICIELDWAFYPSI
jgi:hypothetical protein